MDGDKVRGEPGHSGWVRWMRTLVNNGCFVKIREMIFPEGWLSCKNGFGKAVFRNFLHQTAKTSWGVLHWVTG